MSNLSDLLPAGAGGKQVSFTASGAISNGDTVILNSNGTVSVVSATATPQAIGSPTVFKASRVDYVASAYDAASGKVVIVYVDFNAGSYGTAVVGTVSGTSISFGSATYFNAASTGYVSATYDSTNQKVVIAYQGSSSYGTAIVGTVSGTSISFGSATQFETAAIGQPSITFDSANSKVFIAYADGGNSNYGTGVVGTVSGTSISFGTPAVFQSAQLDYVTAVYDPSSGRVVISYPDNNNSFYGSSRVATISGTSFTSVAPVVFRSSWITWPSSVYDSTTNKVVIAYSNFGSSSYGTAIVGSISGTTISFGSSVVFEYASSDYFALSYDAFNEKVVISYRDGGNSNYGTLIVGTVSGTSISFGTASVFESAHANNISSVYDSVNQKVVISYKDSGNSSWGTAVVFRNESTNSADFIGIADESISDTASGNITIKGGISTNVTGLTPNATYYVQADGSLSTTASSVLAGKALSTTSINLDYTS